MFSWIERLVIQVVQRILDSVLWPSPVRAHWVAYKQYLCQTWEWAFSAQQDEIAASNQGQIYDTKGPCQLETGSCHLPLQRLNHGHCSCWPSTPPKGVQGGNQEWGTLLWEKLAEQAFRELDIFRKRFYESQFLHLLIHRETLILLKMISALANKKNIKSQNSE